MCFAIIEKKKKKKKKPKYGQFKITTYIFSATFLLMQMEFSFGSQEWLLREPLVTE
jgi:hypothetical protein